MPKPRPLSAEERRDAITAARARGLGLLAMYEKWEATVRAVEAERDAARDRAGGAEQSWRACQEIRQRAEAERDAALARVTWLRARMAANSDASCGCQHCSDLTRALAEDEALGGGA